MSQKKATHDPSRREHSPINLTRGRPVRSGSGEIDFDEFCDVIQHGRAGAGAAFARVVKKVMEDAKLRSLMHYRIEVGDSPISATHANAHQSALQEQLDRTRAERKWLAGIQLTSTGGQAIAARAGYNSESGTRSPRFALEPMSAPPPPPPRPPVRASPPVHRTANKMLPDLGGKKAQSPQSVISTHSRLQQLSGQGIGFGLHEPGRSASLPSRRPPAAVPPPPATDAPPPPPSHRSTSHPPRHPPGRNMNAAAAAPPGLWDIGPRAQPPPPTIANRRIAQLLRPLHYEGEFGQQAGAALLWG